MEHPTYSLTLLQLHSFSVVKVSSRQRDDDSKASSGSTANAALLTSFGRCDGPAAPAPSARGRPGCRTACWRPAARRGCARPRRHPWLRSEPPPRARSCALLRGTVSKRSCRCATGYARRPYHHRRSDMTPESDGKAAVNQSFLDQSWMFCTMAGHAWKCSYSRSLPLVLSGLFLR